MSVDAHTPPKRGLMNRFLDAVEFAGNKLPDPVTLFLYLIGAVMGISALAAWLGVTVTHPGTGEAIRAVNLFSGEQIQRLFVEMPRTFANFPPLGLVLLVMLGIGIADKTGLIAVALRQLLGSVPPALLTATVAFAGVMSSIAVDAGYVVVIPMGALLFYNAGRHPLAGLATAFAGVAGGFSANLSVTSLDPLLAGFTQPAAQLLDPAYTVLPTANYYLMVALVPVFTLLATLVTVFIVEPRLGRYSGTADGGHEDRPLTPLEKKGLRVAGVVFAVVIAGILALVVPPGAPFRNAEGAITPFYSALVGLLMVAFLLPGLAYGIVTKQIENDKDAAKMAGGAMSDLGMYLVLAFVTAHFTALFAWSNLGTITAISGAQFLQAVGFTGTPLLVSFIGVVMIVNIFIGSASAKWALMAPIFVPMLMQMGYAPELTQAAYRLGDAPTNMITPLLPYFPLILVFAQRYVKDTSLGTLIALMLPYALAYGVASIVLLLVWMAFGIPLGPGIPTWYTP